jgi:hypothetical protein
MAVNSVPGIGGPGSKNDWKVITNDILVKK